MNPSIAVWLWWLMWMPTPAPGQHTEKEKA